METPHPSRQNNNVAHDWREANRQAIMASNDWVEAHGLPLRAQRLF